MKLSIVIVNYNVKYILEQCLHSVFAAIQNIEAEVFVVDNNSVDGSCTMITEKFPWVHLIENKENVGFSKANNQAIRISKGEYILLLNPDTVVEEDTFTKTIAFMDEHPQGGGLGVAMIDGKGKFLPESKRGLPTLSVSFYKMFGFHKVFPHSKRFNYYYLGHLSNNEVHEIEILSGAFMLMRKSVLDKIGLLDEEYFMYGEDIDLSYRIIKAGYKNYYYPHTTIIHYKGESTKKASFKYVMVFYKAMEIFARKQLHMKKYSLYSLFIHIAIWARALIALVSRIIKKVLFPIIDTFVIYAGFFTTAHLWASHHFGPNAMYPIQFFTIIAPLFTLLWVIAIYFSSGYERSVKIANIFKGIFAGFIAILIVYALFPESLRYSRALIFFTCIWGILLLPLIRVIFHVLKISNFRILIQKNKQIVLVGDEQENTRVYNFLKQTNIQVQIVGFVSIDNKVHDTQYLGTLNQLQEIVNIYGINEIIFCMRDVGASNIIKHMLEFSDLQVDFKIAPPESFSVIGSNSSNTTGELYTIELNSVAKGLNKKKKRMFDIVTSLMLILGSIFLCWFVKHKQKFIKHCFEVLLGSKTWVGYAPQLQELQKSLPKLKPGIVYPGMQLHTNNIQILEQAHIVYVKDYKMRNDALIVIACFNQLGN